MTVREIITAYLRERGYDGLCNAECGCGLDDLAPCGGDCGECVPAYKRPSLCAICETKCDGGSNENALDSYCYGPTKFISECPKCKSSNIKCRGAIYNCEDCGERWGS